MFAWVSYVAGVFASIRLVIWLYHGLHHPFSLSWSWANRIMSWCGSGGFIYAGCGLQSKFWMQILCGFVCLDSCKRLKNVFSWSRGSKVIDLSYCVVRTTTRSFFRTANASVVVEQLIPSGCSSVCCNDYEDLRFLHASLCMKRRCRGLRDPF